MHPFRLQSKDGHNEKLRKMTDHYGSADPKASISAPTNKYKQEGPEDDVGFGADSTMARARGDRPAKKPQANSVATLKKGGRVKNRNMGGNMPPVTPTVMPSGSMVAPMPGAVPQGSGVMNSLQRAHGGRAKKGATNVTVVVAPQTPSTPAGTNPALAHPVVPPAPPMPPPGPPGPPGAPPGPMPPGMPPPGIMPPRAAGGRVGTLGDQGLSASSPVGNENGITHKGGKITGYDAGSLSGEGRLEKIKNYGKRESHRKPQTV